MRNTLWGAFGVVLGRCGRLVGKTVSPASRRASIPDEDAFGEALDHYLKGDYYQAEQMLEGLLRRNVRDLDARLMLATLLRHTGRLDEATRQLDTLARFEGAGKWELEIEQERELLAKRRRKCRGRVGVL